MTKVNVVGWYGMRNVGDEAFRMVFEQQLGGLADLTFSQRPVDDSSFLLYGGGGVVVKSYIAALKPERPWYAVGVDVPLSGPDWDLIASSGMREIYCRSREYAYLAKRQTERIKYCPDIVFALDYDRSSFPVRPDVSGETWIGVTITHEIQGRWHELRDAIQDLTEKGARVFLIPMYSGEYRPDVQYFQEFLINERVATVDVQTVSEAMGVISMMDFTINMRFHASIFSVMLGVPFLSLANKGKHSLFCEQEGLMDSFIDIGEYNSYKILSGVEKITKNQELESRLSAIAFCNKAHVSNVFSSTVSKWIVDSL